MPYYQRHAEFDVNVSKTTTRSARATFEEEEEEEEEATAAAAATPPVQHTKTECLECCTLNLQKALSHNLLAVELLSLK